MRLLTAAEADRGARAAVGRLRLAGIEPRQRVAIAIPGRRSVDQSPGELADIHAATVVAVLGCLRNGVVPVLANPALPDPERRRILSDCRPSLVIDTGANMLALVDPDDAPPAPEMPHMPRARAMHYTSGTTGDAKGIWTGMLTGDEAEAWWRDELEQWPDEASDITLVHGPVAHHGPLRFAIMTLLAGGSALIPDRFDAPEMARALARHAPTTAFVVPSHMQRVLAVPGGPPPSPYRRVLHAGAPCPEPLKRAIHKWAGAERVWEFYGSTEGQFTACSGAEWEERPGTVGRARRRRRVFTDDGVVWCEGPSCCRFEYFGDPAKTAAAWRDTPGGGAAFTVGDLGRLDGDGYLWLDGRREDLVITGGVNVYPARVESVICGIPGVDQAAVFGVADERWGQRVCAAYVGTAEPGDVTTRCRAELATYEIPKDVYRLDALPTTPSGKIMRLDLADLIGPEGS